MISDVTNSRLLQNTEFRQYMLNSITTDKEQQPGINAASAESKFKNLFNECVFQVNNNTQRKRSHSDVDAEKGQSKMKMKVPKTNPKQEVPLSNRFAVLSNLEDAEDQMSCNDEEETEDIPATNIDVRKPKRLPPIVIHGSSKDHKQLVQTVKEHVKGEFYFKHTKNTTNVFIKDLSDWNAFKNFAKSAGVDFHTFSLPEEKTHGFVIRGFNNGIEATDVSNSLAEDHGIKVKNVYLMRTKTTRPLFLVVTDANIVLKDLQNNIRFVCNTRVFWDRHKNHKGMTQCHKCQGWGHATTNCFAQPRCLKCAKGHSTKDCDLEENGAPKCANCGQDHTANSTSCPVYVGKLEFLQKLKQDTKPAKATTYIPAPQPVTNVWEDRQKHFPALKAPSSANGAPKNVPQTTKSTLQLHPSTAANVPPTQHSTASGMAGIGDAEGIDIFKELNQEMGKLNTKINLGKFLSALKQLNTRLDVCTDESSKFLTFYNFLNSLGENGF